jgi:outer membrane protein assembly factor BamD (BamD/ComL family)
LSSNNLTFFALKIRNLASKIVCNGRGIGYNGRSEIVIRGEFMDTKSFIWRFQAAAVLLAVSVGVVTAAETWILGDNQDWENIADNPHGGYMLAVTNVKQLINTGQLAQAQKAVGQLKKDFPQIAGADLDVFMVAEELYAQGKWVKAVRGYDEFLNKWPDSGLYESALERQYSVAVAFLGGQKRQVLKVLKLSAYDEAVKIMTGIADRGGDSPIAQRSLETLAVGQEERGKCLDAYETWADISSRWGTGRMGRVSLLGMARSLHSAYTGPKYDSAVLDSARSYYENYRLRYPDQAAEEDIAGKIATVDEQLAYKRFSIGQYYSKTDSPAAAQMYYQIVIDQWADTAAAKMAAAEMAGGPQDATGTARSSGLGKSLFKAGNVVLDSWFGLKPHGNNSKAKEAADESAND